MANYASRLAKLEQQTNMAPAPFVCVNQRETTEDAWQRYTVEMASTQPRLRWRVPPVE